MNRTIARALGAALLFALCLPAQELPGKPDAKAKADPLALTLENLFPKKGIFGPTPSDIEISRSGRYAAWTHRPYVERRHGSDLYVMDLSTGEVRRATDVRTMAAFQSRAREVLKDREEKAKKRKKEGEAKDTEKSEAKDSEAETAATEATSTKDAETAEATTKGDARAAALRNMHVDTLVGEKDADDEKAPRYSGISRFTWSPTAEMDEILLTSEGDVYRYQLAEDRLERLTKTSERVSSAAWLPDGSGYTYLDDGRLMRVQFGSHLIEEIQPRFSNNERLTGYSLSPDGARAVFVTRTGSDRRSGGRTVKIAKYTGRFMEVQEVPRTVSDDPIPKGEAKLYLYELAGVMQENGPLVHIHTFENTGPRDVVRTPEWSPDSSRVTFSTFEQKSSQVAILESVFPDSEEVEKLTKEAEKKDKDRKSGDPVEQPAEIVYRFLHDGGPNTPRMIEPLYLADSRHVLFLSEQSGFRHLHVLDPVYQSQHQLSWGRYEVYPIRLSHDRKHVFVSATKEDSARLDVYRVDVETGAMERLTPSDGTYSDAAVSDTGHVVAKFAAWGEGPTELVHVAPDHTQTLVTESHPKPAHVFTARAPELFAFENRHGQEIRGFLFEPERAEGEKRPLLVYVYGGPLGTRKNVVDGTYHSDAYLFARYMCEVHGYVTCTIDPRGMSGYGALFEKANFEQVGRPQVEDLVDGVEYLIETRDVDPEKVGIHGWSFGGFQTQMCLYTEPDVFKVGIAGAGPTEWQNYNSWYSTGTIGPSREGKTDLEKYSLLPLAKNLKGKLMLVHGMEDSNVLYQDTVRVYRELLKAGKETLVELFLDPTGGHGLGGDVERVGRARKYEEFLTRTLGSIEAAEAAAKPAEPDEAIGTAEATAGSGTR